MRRFGLVLLVGALLLPVLLVRAAEPQQETARLKSLVAQLSSERFKDREAASRLLEQVGEPALPLLHAALGSPDLELRRRAEDLISRIEVKRDTARALVPARVRFQCQDKTVLEAVAEFARVTGQPIQLAGDPTKLAARRLTLDTGDTTFWDAFGQLCTKAGIRETEAPQEQAVQAHQVYFRGGRRRGFMAPSYYPQQRSPADTTLMLEDGTAPNYASIAAGALRVRAVPDKGSAYTDLPDGTKQVSLHMEVRPEARLEWTQLIALRIERAVDDTGRKVSHTGDFIESGFDGNLYMDNMQFMQMNDMDIQQTGSTSLRQIPISIIVGSKSVRNLRELSGTVCGRVRTAPEPIVTIDNLPKAVGKATKGVDGSEVKITECKRGTDSLCQLTVELKVTLATQMVDNMNGIFLGGRRPQLDQANILLNKDDPTSAPFKVFNAKGEALEFVTGTLHVQANNFASRIFTLVYKPGTGDSEPAKLEYVGRREVLVEVPFTLKDVPLVVKSR